MGSACGGDKDDSSIEVISGIADVEQSLMNLFLNQPNARLVANYPHCSEHLNNPRKAPVAFHDIHNAQSACKISSPLCLPVLFLLFETANKSFQG